jgi:hypothetical protein
MLNVRRPLASFVALVLACGLAQAADPQSPDYKAGFEAGYKAALEALRAGGAAPPAGAASAPVAPAGATAPATVAAPAARPAGPPDWWNHSSLMYPELVKDWRHRVEVQLAGTSLSGNDEGYAWRGGAKWFARSGQWTNEVKANLDRRHIVQPGGGLNQRDFRLFEESIRYDFTPKAYGAAGFILERDDVNYIERRGTLLAGLGYYILDNEKYRFNVFGGLGRLRERYLEPVPSLIGVDGRGSGLLYLYQTFDWQINPQWSFQQGFRHMRDLDESGIYGPDPTRPGLFMQTGLTKRYRNVGSVALNYQLNPRSSVSLAVESRYDSNPWPDVEPRDITRRLIFNLLY